MLTDLDGLAKRAAKIIKADVVDSNKRKKNFGNPRNVKPVARCAELINEFIVILALMAAPLDILLSPKET